jgi:hypothetical protein
MKSAIRLIQIPLLGAALCMPFAAHAQHVSVGFGFRIGPPPPVRVWVAPPPPYQEQYYAAPGPGYVWVAGHYSWINGQWVWIRGQWVVPPQPGYYWVAGAWDSNRNWIEGHWEIAQSAPPPVYGPAPGEAVVYDAPPPPIVEVQTAPPSPYHIWIGGYWGWDGHRRYWAAGHWELPPHPHAFWVQPRWEHRDGRYVFVRGYWR